MQRFDTTRAYETPEGIILELKIAGPVVRASAWLIDLLIRSAVYIALGIILGFWGGVGGGIYLIGIFIIEWFYPVWFEIQSGATPGKKTMGLVVIHDNGTPISWSSSIVRNLVRAADFFPFFYGLGLVTMLANRDFKRLGDLAAGTLVVYREKLGERQKIPEATPKNPPQGLTAVEQRTILDLAERSEKLSKERCIELAEILSTLTEQKGQAAIDEIYAYANWLAKGR